MGFNTNITFEPIVKKVKPNKIEINIKAEKVKEVKQEPVDDKPSFESYDINRVKGGKLFKEGKFKEALRYFELAQQYKDSMWIRGRINTCKKEINDENYSD